MIKKINQTKRLLKYIEKQIDERKPERVIWLGYSPGFPFVFQLMLEKGITDVKVYDNDKNKHGWTIQPVKSSDFIQKELSVQPFDIKEEDREALFFSANTHYKDFVKQLSDYNIGEEKIIDLYEMLDTWMWEEERPIISDYHQLIGRQLQLEQLKILKWFKDFCTDNKLTWCLGEGTMLGAVRHKGFIPWDDDIDVFMPYEDYLKCIELFPENGKYDILDWRTESQYPFQFAKVIENGTYQIHSMPFGYFTLGCYIDIFPIAGFPDNEEKISAKLQRHRVLDAKWDYSLILGDIYPDIYNDCRQEITDEKYKIPFYEAKLVGTMQQIAGNPWAIPREAFSEMIDMQFEDDVFPVPIGYDTFLTARYGDYMTPPPVEKRRIHSYPTYKVQ